MKVKLKKLLVIAILVGLALMVMGDSSCDDPIKMFGPEGPGISGSTRGVIAAAMIL